MCTYICSQLMRALYYVLYVNHAYNKNKSEDKNILLVEISKSLNALKSESKFKFSCAKLKITVNLNEYRHMYSSCGNYVSFFEECITILESKDDDEKVIEELNVKLGNCDDLFIIYLFYSMLHH